VRTSLWVSPEPDARSSFSNSGSGGSHHAESPRPRIGVMAWIRARVAVYRRWCPTIRRTICAG